MTDFGLANCLQTAPNKLVFTVTVKQVSEARLTLTNPTNARIGYKVKLTAPKSFSVKPAAGILEPGAECMATVTRMADTQLPVPGGKCKDKFRVEALTMPPGVSTVSSELFQVYKQHVVRTNIKVALIAAQHTPLAAPLPQLPQPAAGRSAARRSAAPAGPAAAPAAMRAAKPPKVQDSPAPPVPTATLVADTLCGPGAGLAGAKAAAGTGSGPTQAARAAGPRVAPAAAARPATAAASHPAAAAPAEVQAALQPLKPSGAASIVPSKPAKSGHARARVGRGSGARAAETAAAKRAGASGGVPTAGLEDLVLGPGDPGFDGDRYVGRAVHKKFLDGKMYTGVVTEFIPQKKWFNIKYEDSDSEDVFWEELRSILQPAKGGIVSASPGRAKPAAARPTGIAKLAAKAGSEGSEETEEDSGTTHAAETCSGGMQTAKETLGWPRAEAAAGRGTGTVAATPLPLLDPGTASLLLSTAADKRGATTPLLPAEPDQQTPMPPFKPPPAAAGAAERTPADGLVRGVAAATEDMLAPEEAAGPAAFAGPTPVGEEQAQQAAVETTTPLAALGPAGSSLTEAAAPASELPAMTWSVRRPRTEGTRRRRGHFEPLAAAIEKLGALPALPEEETTPSPEACAAEEQAESLNDSPAHQPATQSFAQEELAAKTAVLLALVERQKEQQQLQRQLQQQEADREVWEVEEQQGEAKAKPRRQGRLWRRAEDDDEDWVPPEHMEEELPKAEAQSEPTAAAAAGKPSSSSGAKQAPAHPWTLAKQHAAQQQKSGGSLQPKPAKSGHTPAAVAAGESEVIDLVDSDEDEGQTLAARSAQRAQQARQQQQQHAPGPAAVKREPGLGKTPSSKVQLLLNTADDSEGLGGAWGAAAAAAEMSGASCRILTCTKKGNAAKRARLAGAAGAGEGSQATTVDMCRADSVPQPAVSQGTTAAGPHRTPAATTRSRGPPSHRQQPRRRLRTKSQLRQEPRQLTHTPGPEASQPLDLSVRSEGGQTLMTLRVKPTTQLAKLLAAVERTVGETVREEAGVGAGAALSFMVGELQLPSEGKRQARVRDVRLGSGAVITVSCS